MNACIWVLSIKHQKRCLGDAKVLTVMRDYMITTFKKSYFFNSLSAHKRATAITTYHT
jgi:hypothetical protein